MSSRAVREKRSVELPLRATPTWRTSANLISHWSPKVLLACPKAPSSPCRPVPARAHEFDLVRPAHLHGAPATRTCVSTELLNTCSCVSGAMLKRLRRRGLSEQLLATPQHCPVHPSPGLVPVPPPAPDATRSSDEALQEHGSGYVCEAARALLSQRWSTIVSDRWRWEEHINVLELCSTYTALRWSLSSPASVGTRVIILSDSMVAVGATAKGRWSAPPILRRTRAIAAATLASGVSLSSIGCPRTSTQLMGPRVRFQRSNMLARSNMAHASRAPSSPAAPRLLSYPPSRLMESTIQAAHGNQLPPSRARVQHMGQHSRWTCNKPGSAGPAAARCVGGRCGKRVGCLGDVCCVAG